MYGTTTIPLRGDGVMELSRKLQVRRSELDRYLNRANRAGHLD